MHAKSIGRFLSLPAAVVIASLGTAAHAQNYNLSAVPTGTGSSPR
jgi:hypothetical protein